MGIRAGAIMEDGVTVGRNLDTGYYVVLRQRVKVGDDVCIWSHTVIDPDSIIGNGVKIHANCYLAQQTIVEDGVFIGPNVTILNDRYPPRYDQKDWEPVVIKAGAIIGGGAVIGPGVVIGTRAIIGAGAVVIRSVPPGEVWAGVPGKRIVKK